MRRWLPVAVVAVIAGCGGSGQRSPDVVAKAMRAYADAKMRGMDLSRGP